MRNRLVGAACALLCFVGACGGKIDGSGGGSPAGTYHAPPNPTDAGPGAGPCGPMPNYLCPMCVSPTGATYGSADPLCTDGTWACAPLGSLPLCRAGFDPDGGVQDPDADAYPPDAPISLDAGLPPSACSIVGTWNVTANGYYGTDASFEFNADGTFVGGPRAAMLPSGAIYAGSWTLVGDTLTIGSTSGFRCNMGTTVEQLSFMNACDVVTLTDVGDDCTGGRNYFDGSVLTRQ